MFSIEQINKSNVEEIKEYHLKKLYQLSKFAEGQLEFRVDGSIWKDGKRLVEEPDDDQKEWVLFRLSHSNTWPKVYENKIGDFKNWI